MCDITVVCCYNNEKVYGDFVDTLKTQNIPYELIGIDNGNNKKFSSCSAAYNSIINQVKTKYIIYSHQDILLTEPDALKNFLAYLERISENDILGVAGVKFGVGGVFSGMKHYDNATKKIIRAGGNDIPGALMEVDTIDECFFGGHTEYFRKNFFDDVLCDDWHLYVVEQSLRVKISGHKVFVCDAQIIHLSSGNHSPSLYTGFYRLCRKYAPFFPEMHTTCLHTRTDFKNISRYCTKYYIRAVLRKFLRRLGLYERVKKFLG